MSKITILQGLPASGKSTLAKELVRKCGGNTVRLNKDLLRTMLHFSKFTTNNERTTQNLEYNIARDLLAQNISVVIDDTNLNPKTITAWKAVAKSTSSKLQYIRTPLETSIHECIQRDNARNNGVGSHVIMRMAMQYELDPLPAVGYILCDLDGTLCDTSQRQHYVRKDPKDWKSFFAEIPQDPLRRDTYSRLMTYQSQGYTIILVTARSEDHRTITTTWLKQNCPTLKYHALIMRRTKDSRQDSIVKQQILHTYFPTSQRRDLIHVVIDDRPSVIRMWKEEGLKVIDVGDGIDF